MNTGQKIGVVLLYIGTIISLALSFLTVLPDNIALYISELSDCTMLIGVSILTGALNNSVEQNVKRLSDNDLIKPFKDNEQKETTEAVEVVAEIKDTNQCKEVETLAQPVNKGTNENADKTVLTVEDIERLKSLLAGEKVRGGEIWTNKK